MICQNLTAILYFKLYVRQQIQFRGDIVTTNARWMVIVGWCSCLICRTKRENHDACGRSCWVSISESVSKACADLRGGIVVWVDYGGFTKYDSFGNVVLAKHAHVCGRQQIARMRMLENVFWNKFDNSRFWNSNNGLLNEVICKQ